MISPSIHSLNHEKILHALGVYPDSGNSDGSMELSMEELNGQISRCEDQILHAASPRTVYRILPVCDLDPLILQGHDIRNLLDGCTETVLMALTLGADLEKCLIREEVLNMADAYVMDVCASIAVEEAADDFEKKLRLELKESGRYLTNRYSPGYGDYPLSVQRPLLDNVNALRAIGLTLTPTNLMVPRKSITAVMGISSQAKPDVYGGCGHCPILEKCSYRRHRTHCWEN